jgi:hypothetical protein
MKTKSRNSAVSLLLGLVLAALGTFILMFRSATAAPPVGVTFTVNTTDNVDQNFSAPARLGDGHRHGPARPSQIQAPEISSGTSPQISGIRVRSTNITEGKNQQ